MEKGRIDVVENLICAVSLLNGIDKYFSSLNDSLSEYDSLCSDYEHLIENTEVDDLNLEELFLKMQETFKERRIIKNDMALRDNYKNLIGRLNSKENREFLIQEIKNIQKKLPTVYKNRILTEEDLILLKTKPKKSRGRPPKRKEEFENV